MESPLIVILFCKLKLIEEANVIGTPKKYEVPPGNDLRFFGIEALLVILESFWHDGKKRSINTVKNNNLDNVV